ncbi:DsrE family protein [Algoriphagus winogradskyi]|uniref:Intracellular sulfur oxidation protein, DsrE/DsrF family n=1 Tax=Algoriphagus winogradskyi TaxID=237017 RepID=A0ABY1NKB4_9BACT|nr:DsrE family protein [Algoriphagus winogradskyi]SMP11326.1 Intracellular sulfur oxidation protein, DsrE/DsrF family [Algoriphagus winogradskyi]
MKKYFFTFIMICVAASFSNAQEIVYPAIQGYGGVNEVPFETIKPDPTQHYKFVVEINNRIEDKKELSGYLDYAAKMYNVHIYSGVPKENIDLVFVVYAGSTPITISNEEYKKRFEVDNPNAGLLEELKKNGIRVIVCGQSMMKQNLVPDMIYPGVEMAVSRFTATTDLMNKGYLLFSL